MKRKVDIRTIRTKKLIKNEILNYIESGKEPSIQAISHTCNLNRNTFYIHYKNIDEAIKEIKEDVADEVVSTFADTPIEVLKVNPNLFIDAIYNIILKNPKYTKVYFDKKYGNAYNGILTKKLTNHFLEQCTDGKYDTKLVRTSIQFFISGLFYSIYDWYQSEDREPIEDLTARLSKIVKTGSNLKNL